MVKGKILCEKVGEISLKGISRPVETYRAVDSYMRRRSAVAGESFWMFMASSGIDRGKITSTHPTGYNQRAPHSSLAGQSPDHAYLETQAMACQRRSAGSTGAKGVGR